MDMNAANNSTSDTSHNHQLWIKSPKVLLVEDTTIIQIVNSSMLRILGCQVDLAKTGIEALTSFKQNYDIIFLDIGLPDLSGLTVAKAIRSEEATNPGFKNILIALTTSSDNVSDACFAAGMDDFHTKPIAIKELEQVLIKWLPNHFNG